MPEPTEPAAPAAVTLTIPPEVVRIATDHLGAYFEPISGIDRRVAAEDFLDIDKCLKRVQTLERYVPLRSKKVLEIGSGFGTNLIAWTKGWSIDGYGVEPGSEGFDSGLRASRLLLAANGLDPSRIVNAGGEQLPFGDESFDVVYSSNVLEHTEDPERVVREALRVLRRGGILHMEMPNFLSYFEGHYMMLQPPILARWMLPAWVRLCGRDPAFARTLNTWINPVWCKAVAARAGAPNDVTVLSLGDDVFLDRLSRAFTFETKAVSGKLGPLLAVLRVLNLGNWIGHLIVALRGYYPIYLTIRKR